MGAIEAQRFSGRETSAHHPSESVALPASRGWIWGQSRRRGFRGQSSEGVIYCQVRENDGGAHAPLPRDCRSVLGTSYVGRDSICGNWPTSGRHEPSGRKHGHLSREPSVIPLLQPKSALKRAAAMPPQERAVKSKIWHDNETFLQVPAVYRRNGLESVRFPPNSGGLNPIETVWARLRRDLGVREREDLKAGRIISVRFFRQRVSQILTSYSARSGGERLNFYERLLRGMPARLSKCRANKYGPCGK